MRVLVTGGDSPWGYSLVHGLLHADGLRDSDGRMVPVDSLTLFNNTSRLAWHDQQLLDDPRLDIVRGDIACPEQIETAIIGRRIQSIFHIETYVRELGEHDLDGMWRTNVIGTRNVLEACRKLGERPKIVFDSSTSSFADFEPGIVNEAMKLLPSSTYGTSKAIGELLVNNYTMLGHVDGKSSLLPGGLVGWRPFRRGENSDQIRRTFLWPFAKDPFCGADIEVNLARNTLVHCNGHLTLIQNLIELHDLPRDALGPDRSVILPAVSVTVQQVLDCVANVADERQIAIGRFVDRPDPARQAEIDAYVKRADAARALSLGLTPESLHGMVIGYLDGLAEAGARVPGRRA